MTAIGSRQIELHDRHNASYEIIQDQHLVLRLVHQRICSPGESYFCISEDQEMTNLEVIALTMVCRRSVHGMCRSD